MPQTDSYSIRLCNSVVANMRSVEDKQYETEFKAEFDAYMKEKNLEVKMTKVYMFLWSQCAV
jgi:hypothetical protein